MKSIKSFSYNNTKQLLSFSLCIVFSSFLLFFLSPSTTHAAYSASDVLGQLQAGQPIYTTSNSDNYTVPNDQGMDYPQGLTLDPIGHRLFVSDDDNNRVLVYNLDQNNNLISHTASYVLGQPDFISNQRNQGNDIPASTTMSYPEGLSYDSTNNRLFVADSVNSRVLVFDLSNGIQNNMPAKYVLGQPDFVSNQQNQGGSPASTTMNAPNSLTYDSTNSRLFVADSGNNRVLVFDLSNGIQNDMPAKYVLGQPDFISNYQNQDSSCNGICSPASTTMNGPYTITYDSTHQHLFIDDDSNYRVLVFDLSNGIQTDMPASWVIGQPDFVTNRYSPNGWYTASSTSVSYPEELAYDSNHNRLFVGDDENNRVLVFDLSGLHSNGIAASHVFGAGTTSMDVVNDGSVVSSTTINDPELGMYYDTGNNRLWMTDDSNNRVLTFDMSNGITDNMPASDVLGQLQAGQPIYTTSNSDNYTVPNDQGMDYPQGLTLDPIGHRLFVSDADNNRVLVYNLDQNNNLISHTASYVLGQPDFISNQRNQGNDIPASTTMYAPEGLSYDSTNSRLFVTDENNNRVLVFDLSNGIQNDMPAKYILGQSDFDSQLTNQGNSGPASTTMNSPAGLAYDSNNSRLFVTDSGNNRVLVFDLSNGIQTDMPAKYVLGQPDFVSYYQNQTPNCGDNACNIASTTMNGPYTITYDSTHQHLFIDDDSNYRVLVFDLSNGIQTDMPASWVIGQPDFVTNEYSPNGWYTASSTSVSYPEELAYDSNHDRLFVGDDINNRILSFDLSGGIQNGMAASGVIGQPDFTSYTSYNDCSASSPSQTSICDPELGMYYDTGNDRLWMTNDSSNRVLSFDFIKLPSSITSRATVGTPYSSSASTTESQGTVSYVVTSGTLPTGIDLDPNTGMLSGTPTVTGAFSFTITATDNIGSEGSFTDSEPYTITVSGSGSPPTPPTPTVSSSGGGGGSSVSPQQLAQILALSATTTAYLNSLKNIVPGCPTGFVCTPIPGYAPTPTIIEHTFTHNLTIGSTGSDIKALQQYLNTHGFTIATTGPGSPSNETTIFGLLTKQALIKFQKANDITPSIGYFGPITRNYINNHP